MKLLLSGEGPTDMGKIEWAGTEQQFVPGPMALIVDRICECRLEYSQLDLANQGADSVRFVRKEELQNRESRPQRLPGRKNPEKNIYYFESARALGKLALAEQKHDDLQALSTQPTFCDYEKSFDAIWMDLGR